MAFFLKNRVSNKKGNPFSPIFLAKAVSAGSSYTPRLCSLANTATAAPTPSISNSSASGLPDFSQ
jgi:hypothetical protein